MSDQADQLACLVSSFPEVLKVLIRHGMPRSRRLTRFSAASRKLYFKPATECTMMLQGAQALSVPFSCGLQNLAVVRGDVSHFNAAPALCSAIVLPLHVSLL